mgnify:CR=1 FL=1
MDADHPSGLTRPAGGHGQGSAVPLVLVVEDDRLTLGLLAETLAQSGFVVGAAASAAAARRLWDQMDPDAVVLDIDLGPGVNGFDLADALDLETAVAYAKALSQYDLFWYEEPGDPLDFELQATLRHQGLPLPSWSWTQRRWRRMRRFRASRRFIMWA